MIEWAFAEYFKTGTFPPKPADITKLIRLKREAMIPESGHVGVSSEEWTAIQRDRKLYFASPEYQEWLKRMKTEHGL